MIDATRLSDGMIVALKRINTDVHPCEREIAQFFSSGDIAHDPRNHCIPILEVLEPPDDSEIIILVMPLLRPFYEPPFYTVGEVVDFLTQIFEVSILHTVGVSFESRISRLSGVPFYA